MANKITKKEMFAMIMKVEGVAQNPEMVEFLAHEIKLLEKKASKSGSTKTQKANAELMPRIIESLAMVGKPVTITELQAEVPAMAEYSNQKLSALLKQLKDNGSVVKVIDKKKSYFSVPTDTKEVDGEEVEE